MIKILQDFKHKKVNGAVLSFVLRLLFFIRLLGLCVWHFLLLEFSISFSRRSTLRRTRAVRQSADNMSYHLFQTAVFLQFSEIASMNSVLLQLIGTVPYFGVNPNTLACLSSYLNYTQSDFSRFFLHKSWNQK